MVLDSSGIQSWGDGNNVTDYHFYGRPVVAPADGIVVEVKDGVRDVPWPGSSIVDCFCRDFRGNHVVIKHTDSSHLSFHVSRPVTVAVPLSVLGAFIPPCLQLLGYLSVQHLVQHFLHQLGQTLISLK